MHPSFNSHTNSSHFRCRNEGTGGYTFVDGGVWANNPIMIGLIEALTSFDVGRAQIRILSIGCGDDPYRVSGAKVLLAACSPGRTLFSPRCACRRRTRWGGLSFAARFRQVLGPGMAPTVPKIELDDWRSAVVLLPPAADSALEADGARVAKMFFTQPAVAYQPVHRLSG